MWSGPDAPVTPGYSQSHVKERTYLDRIPTFGNGAWVFLSSLSFLCYLRPESRKASKAALSGASTLPDLWSDMIDLPLLSHKKSQKVLWSKDLWPWNSETDKKSWQEARGKLPAGLPKGELIRFYSLQYLRMEIAPWAERRTPAGRRSIRQPEY